MCIKGFVGLLILLGAAFAAPASPKCQEGIAQPSVRVLVTKLERAFKEKDAAAVANLAGCAFLVGEYESDNVSYVPPLVFAERFLDEVEALDLTLKEGDIGSTYPKGPTRIFLWMGRGRKQATLFADHRPNADFRHRHVFSFERSADGWRITSYGTKDGDLLELLRRGYPGVLV